MMKKRTLSAGVGIPTTMESTKFGDIPRPKTVYGNWSAMYADWDNWPAGKQNNFINQIIQHIQTNF
jgi:hypothetical protein